MLSAVAVASGFHSVEFGFDEEPGEYRWSINFVESNAIRLRLVEFSELWENKPTDSGRPMLEITTTPHLYAKAVFACAEAVLADYGPGGYSEKWVEHPFPVQALEQLGNAIARWEK